jgi:hypothetical protein
MAEQHPNGISQRTLTPHLGFINRSDPPWTVVEHVAFLREQVARGTKLRAAPGYWQAQLDAYLICVGAIGSFSARFARARARGRQA